MEFSATCPAGFEQLLARELRSLGTAQVRPLRGQVSFAGGLADAYRVCLWSRLASRVIAVLARGGAAHADELYETVADVAWEDQLPAHARFAIEAHGTNRQLRNTQFVALRAKDAVVDRMSSRTGARPQADPTSPDLRIVVRVSREPWWASTSRATRSSAVATRPPEARGPPWHHCVRTTPRPCSPSVAGPPAAPGTSPACSYPSPGPEP